MKNIDLREIAENEGLEYIETTNGMNGYPSNIKGAIIGFNNYGQAEKIANEYGMKIQYFTKKDGWQLWTRTGNTAFGPIENTIENYGDDYKEYSESYYENENEFFEEEVKILFESAESFETAQQIINDYTEIWENIENSEEDEIVITCQGKYYETIKKKSMYFYYDTNHSVVGIINN